MDIEEFTEKLNHLIDKWCSRKELKPLRRILNGQASLNGLTDGWGEMLNELKSIRAQNSKELDPEELKIVVELIHATEKILGR